MNRVRGQAWWSYYFNTRVCIHIVAGWASEVDMTRAGLRVCALDVFTTSRPFISLFDYVQGSIISCSRAASRSVLLRMGVQHVLQGKLIGEEVIDGIRYMVPITKIYIQGIHIYRAFSKVSLALEQS